MPLRRPRAPILRRAAVPSMSMRKTPVVVGGVVAVRAGSQIDICRVTDVAGGGGSVDVVPLKEFVRELYVTDPDARATYARADDVWTVKAEWVASQDGWIVLDADVETARAEFRAADLAAAAPAVVVEAGKMGRRELGEEALKRDRGFGFRAPTRGEAAWGAALCLPIAAACYSAYAGARGAFESGTGAGLEGAVLFGAGAGSVGSLVVGGALAIYAAVGAKEGGGGK